MTDETQEPAAGEDDVRRRFREALERKQGRSATPQGGGGPGAGKGIGPASNEKRQRQFRRKSG